jgi:alcohol dehydrogenase (cytochrome c)
LVVKGKVLVGIAGGEFGVRGFVQAFDAETGKSVWKTSHARRQASPAARPGRRRHLKTGGASTWMTGNYDPATNTSIGAPATFAVVWRSAAGRQSRTRSTLALDGDTGRSRVLPVPPERVPDWDAMRMRQMLVDFRKGGDIMGLLTPQRNGYLYWLKRDADGSSSYLDSEAFVPQNVFKSIDPKTGRPDVDLDHKPATGKKAMFCPGLWGGKDWPFESYDPKTGMVYIPSNENHCNNFEGKVEERIPGQWWTGVAIPDFNYSVNTKAGFFGELQAYDVNTGKRAWRDLYSNSMNWGSVLTTGGGLLFAGGTNDRMFRAYDAQSGEELWHFKTNSGIIAPPSTFEVNGVQYVAVESGYGVDPAFQQTLMADLVGWNPDVPQGGVVWVFAVQK